MRIFKKLPSQAPLRDKFAYEPDTGIFKRRVSLNNKPLVPLTGRADGFKIHRLIWVWMTGDDPGQGVLVDHIDRDSTNNCWSNLRLATYSQNGSNRRNATVSGFKGVQIRGNGFSSQLKYQGVHHYLGYFNTPEQAARAYDKKALELYGEFASLNFSSSP